MKRLAVTLFILLFTSGCTRGSARDMSHECDHIPYHSKAWKTPCPEGYEYDKKYFYQGTDGRTYGSCKLKTTTDNRDCKIRMGPEFEL
jgi:hypothetical protein